MFSSALGKQWRPVLELRTIMKKYLQSQAKVGADNLRSFCLCVLCELQEQEVNIGKNWASLLQQEVLSFLLLFFVMLFRILINFFRIHRALLGRSKRFYDQFCKQ